MMNKIKSLRSMSLVEVLVVMVLISIIATFAAPQFNKMIDSTMHNQMADDIELIMDAQHKYFLRHGDYYPEYPGLPYTARIDRLNEDLKIHLIRTSGAEYYCRRRTPSDLQCSTYRIGDRFGHYAQRVTWMWTPSSTIVDCLRRPAAPCPALCDTCAN